MRHLFIALLIALLPLRGWVGDAMATEMVILQVQAQQQGAIKIIALDALEESVKANFDAEATVGQLGVAAADCADHSAGSGSHADAAHCESCSACQACHTVTLSPVPNLTASAALNLSALPHAAIARFTSAPAARDQKPPIS